MMPNYITSWTGSRIYTRLPGRPRRRWMESVKGAVENKGNKWLKWNVLRCIWTAWGSETSLTGLQHTLL